jgi:hypothetical protein
MVAELLFLFTYYGLILFALVAGAIRLVYPKAPNPEKGILLFNIYKKMIILSALIGVFYFTILCVFSNNANDRIELIICIFLIPVGLGPIYLFFRILLHIYITSFLIMVYENKTSPAESEIMKNINKIIMKSKYTFQILFRLRGLSLQSIQETLFSQHEN